MKLLLSLCLALAGCCNTIHHPNGTVLARFAADETKPDYSYQDKDCRITYRADRRSFSTVSRANWKGLERTAGTIAPMLSPEAAAGAIVPIIGGNQP